MRLSASSHGPANCSEIGPNFDATESSPAWRSLCLSQGGDMLATHKHLKLSDYDFDVTAHEIRNTLYQLGVPRRENEEFMDIIERHRTRR